MSFIIRRRARPRRRGVTLVEVLIVVSIMAILATVTTIFVIPEWKKARVRTAAIGAGQVKQAALIYKEIDLGGDGVSCPTVEELVSARKLEKTRSDDPWGTRYNVTCDEEIHGVSAGSDRKPSTPDDVRDDIKKPDVERIAAM